MHECKQLMLAGSTDVSLSRSSDTATTNKDETRIVDTLADTRNIQVACSALVHWVVVSIFHSPTCRLTAAKPVGPSSSPSPARCRPAGPTAVQTSSHPSIVGFQRRRLLSLLISSLARPELRGRVPPSTRSSAVSIRQASPDHRRVIFAHPCHRH